MSFNQLNRRQFIAVLGSVAAAWPLAARGQKAAPVPHVGLVSIGADPSDPVVFRPFLEQMRRLGYVDGQNIVLQPRFAAGHDERINDFIAELVQRKTDVIVVTGIRESMAAKKATSTIPIVTIVIPDPIELGLATSLAHPGGNVTGLSTMDWGLYGKRLEMLKRAIPSMSKAALLLSRGNPTYRRGSRWASDVERDARSLGVELSIVEIETQDVETAIAMAAADGCQGIIGASDGVVVAARKEIAESAIKHRLPTIFAFRQNVEAGGLMMYAARVDDLSRRAAVFVDRILKGAKPSELPIEQPTIFELIINLKTVKALGLQIPDNLLALADEVIE
jgi:putative ABC transport system substrate-binding protein